MPTIIPNSRTILSIYPLDLEKFARHNGLVTYKHPAAKRDSVLVRTYNPERMSNSNPGSVPASEAMFHDVERACEVSQGYNLIRLYDTFTWSRDFSQDRERYMPHPLSALEVANELVASWALDVVEGNSAMGPGLLVIAGDEPTAEELATVRARQTSYARTLINSASSLFAKGDLKNISDLHRKMGEWMSVKNLPWVVKLEQVEMKSCKACGESIRVTALRCKECNVDLVDFYTKHGLVPDATEDPAVFALLEKSTARKTIKAA